VATEGWAETSGTTATELAQGFADSGACAIIYTDIARDGMLAGVNVAATAALARAVAIPVIASGGVASVQDIRDLRAAGADIEGAILGRALYDGRVDPAEALALAA
jgi:phosphoribosylformimino-5-aminoimidazole carboxamide ribotide isomerase